MIPSDVAAEFLTNPPTDAEEAEGLIQRILSLLATLEPPGAIIRAQDIWHCLCCDDAGSADKSQEEWIIGLKLIGSTLRDNGALLSPFEIHNIATQASVFCETQVGLYFTTCILVCCFALWKCPPRVTSRPKRWRSLLFETIRLSQGNLDSLGVNVLVDNIIPACIHVRSALPEGTDTLHWLAAFQSSVMQMTSYCSLKVVRDPDSKDRSQSIEKLCQGVEDVMGGNFETVLHARYFSNEKHNVKHCSHAKWIKQWMSGMAEDGDHDALASVDTLVDEVGLSELSCFWFDWSGRPQIFSGSHLWHLLFPSVSILLNADECIKSQQHGFLLLQRLLSLISKTSLPTPSPRRPDHPVGAFQLLSNRIINDAASKPGPKANAELPNGSQAFQLMKALLSKYLPRDQIRFVQRLHAQCPQHGLKPKIMDLLRDIVTWNDSSALAKAWSFLDSHLGELEEYIRSDGQLRVVDTENLIMEAEDFIALMGIFRLWYMLRKTPTGVPDLESRLTRVVRAVSQTVSTTQSLDMFRLGLLENAAQLVLDWPDKGAMEDD